MKPITVTCWLSVFSCLLLIGESCNSSQASEQKTKNTQDQYQCLPCGSDCDKVTYKTDGECSQCHMKLVKKSSVKFHSVAAAEICDYIKKHPEAVLLDVRTKEEFEGKTKPNFGTLKNAINIPVQELERKLSAISHLKDKEVLVFCSHSHRSPRASYLLMQNGFTNVTNMDGGMSVVTDASCKK
jgi:rhodanese-related sulfurtransferase